MAHDDEQRELTPEEQTFALCRAFQRKVDSFFDYMRIPEADAPDEAEAERPSGEAATDGKATDTRSGDGRSEDARVRP